MAAMNNLKSCPFCGGKAFVLKRNDNGFVLVYVVCKACHAGTNGKVKESFAVDAWNRRSDDNGK